MKQDWGYYKNKEQVADAIKFSLGHYPHKTIVIERQADREWKIWASDLEVAEVEPALKGEHLEREH